MKLYVNKLKKIHGYEEGKIDAVDTESSALALDYKKTFLRNFTAISPEQIDIRLGGSLYYVTRKYDGEYAIIFFEDGEAVTINRSGRVRRGIPCIEEAGILLAKAGIKQAVIPAEIYVEENSKHRNRVNDLVSVLADEKRIPKLKLAAFDILQLDHKPFRPANYQQTIDRLDSIFYDGVRIHPVDMQTALSNDEVKEIFHQWVEKEGSEGLVVRSEMPYVFKIKPRHSIDTVVVGFTEGTGDQKGQVRTLLLAMMPEEGKYQVVGRIGGGMKTELKAEMFSKFEKTIVGSEYIDTDSNHVAFRMIRPETVAEISINDLIYETGGGTITNPVLSFDEKDYHLNSTVEGFSFIAPIFERFREDKVADSNDVRVSQIDEFSFFEHGRVESANSDLPESELLLRVAFRKITGSKIMVQKYMVWKTNKEETGDYPAYVFHYTNFSSERKEPLQREVMISDSFDQIMELQEKAMRENVKKGWLLVESSEFFADPEYVFDTSTYEIV